MPDILGCRVDNVNMKQAVERVESLVAAGGFAHVVTLNAEIAYIASQNAELRRIINAAELVTPDGSGIVWAASKLESPVEERVAGIDLMTELCAAAENRHYSVYLLGAAEGIAERAAAKIKSDHPNIDICGLYHGFFLREEGGRERIIAELQRLKPDIVFVAMGAPKQEQVIDEFRAGIDKGICIGVGGSFDVFAGEVKRAPQLIQNLRLEWLWRTVLQPSRWKRTMRLPLFMLQVSRQKKNK